MKYRVACLIGMVFVCVALAAQTNLCPLLPVPQQCRMTDCSFALGKTRLSTSVLRPEWEAFVVNGGGEVAENASSLISVELVEAIGEARLNQHEAYRLRVSAREIKVEATTEQGVYWALQTLRQLERKKGKKTRIAGCEIVDWPAFRVRGFMQDVGRSYISLDELKREIEVLSRFKVNVFHLRPHREPGLASGKQDIPDAERQRQRDPYAGKILYAGRGQGAGGVLQETPGDADSGD